MLKVYSLRPTKYRLSSPSIIEGQNYGSLPRIRSWVQYYLLKIVRNGLHFINYKQWLARSNGRANYGIPRRVLRVYVDHFANLRYVKFCACNSHSQNKLYVVFCLSFSLKRLRFLAPAWLRENTAIFTADAVKSRQLHTR